LPLPESDQLAGADIPVSRIQTWYAKYRSRSHDALICVYDAAGNLIETREHKGDFKE